MSDENLGRAVLALTTDDKDLDKGLHAAERKGHSWIKRVGGLVGKGIKAAAIGAVAAAGITVAALGSTIGPASDLAESATKVGVVFGEQADVVKAFADTAAVALGMTEQEALAAAGTYGNLFRAMNMGEDTSAEMSTSLVQLAADLASFNNMDPTEVLDKLRAGLTGETEPLKTLGVNMNQAALEAKALELGLLDASGEMSAAAKAQAAYAIIMEQTALAQGDFARTSEGLANQQRILKAQLGDLRATVGAALLPALEAIIGKVTELAQSEKFQEWIGRLVEGLTVIGEAVGEVVEVITWTLEQGGDLEMVLRNVLSVLLEQLGLTEEQMDGVFEVINKVQDAFLAVTGFIEENATPILAALAAMLLAVVVPAFVTWATVTIAAMAPVVLPILAIGAAVGLLVAAWEKDWGGIRTALTAFWEETGKPIFETVKAWLEEKIPQAIAILKKFWEEVLLPALQIVWAFIEEKVFPTFAIAWDWLQDKIPAAVSTAADFWNTVLWPALEKVWAFLRDRVFPIFTIAWEWLQETLPAAVQTLANFWNETLWPALQSVWAFIDEYIIPIFKALDEVYIAALNLALTALQGMWENVLLPALTAVWEFIRDKVAPILTGLADEGLAGVEEAAGTLSTFWNETLKPALEGVWAFIKDNLGPILVWFKDEVVEKLTTALDSLKGALTWVKDRLNELKNALKNLTLPDWLTPGSPTPLEWGLRGIAEAMGELNRVQLPDLRRNLSVAMPATTPLAALERSAQNSTTFQIANYAPRAETRLELRHLITALELAHV